MGTMETVYIVFWIMTFCVAVWSGVLALGKLDAADKLEENAPNDWEFKAKAQKANTESARTKSDREARNARKRKKEAEIAKAIKEKDVENAKEVAAKRFALKLSTLERHLPFDPSKKTPSTELAEHDKNIWDDVTQLIKNQDNQKTSLYFVKIRSLMDDREYFKIGITTKNVKTMFKKSTEIELLEEVKIFDTEKWKAAFLEYHFLREFRLYDGLSTSIGEQRPEVRFSGYTEVVRSNSVNKISEYFEELDVYNRIYLR